MMRSLLLIATVVAGMMTAHADRLSAMGEWLKVNGRSVYGCTQAPEGFAAPEYSVLTYNPKLRRLYVHLVFYPMGALACPFGDQVAYAQFLHDGSEVKIAPLPQALTGKYPEAPKYNFILPVVKPALEMPVIECYLRDAYTWSATPCGVMLSIYAGPDTRGFSWQTDASVTEGQVDLLKGLFGRADAERFAREGTHLKATCYTGGASDAKWSDPAECGRQFDDAGRQMFGVLRVNGGRLTYDFYVANADGTATLYDFLGIFK